MNDTGTILRILKLLNMLQQRPRKSVKDLAARLDCSPRTIYRHLELIENLKFEVDKDEQSRYFIHLPFNQDDPLDMEEKGLLADLLSQEVHNNPIAASIKRKLALQHPEMPTPEELGRIQQYHIVSIVRQAMRLGKAVYIRNYQTLYSGDIRDRIVQPLQFDEAFKYLTAYDLEINSVRQFHLKRMESVELTHRNANAKIDLSQMDLFGFSSGSWMSISLALSQLASQLLIENFPDAKPYLKQEGEEFVFNHKVRSWIGIGRFVMGLPGHVRVLEPDVFRQYLHRELKQANY